MERGSVKGKTYERWGRTSDYRWKVRQMRHEISVSSPAKSAIRFFSRDDRVSSEGEGRGKDRVSS